MRRGRHRIHPARRGRRRNQENNQRARDRRAMRTFDWAEFTENLQTVLRAFVRQTNAWAATVMADVRQRNGGEGES
jgi:hypothetical protein